MNVVWLTITDTTSLIAAVKIFRGQQAYYHILTHEMYEHIKEINQQLTHEELEWLNEPGNFSRIKIYDADTWEAGPNGVPIRREDST